MAYGAYDRFAMGSGLADAGFLTGIALNAATGDKFVFTVLEPIVVLDFRLLATTGFNYDTMTQASKVSLDRRRNYGSDTNRAELVELTLPQGLAAGKFLRKNFTPVKMLPGEQLVVKVKAQGAGGAGIAGVWQPVIVTAPAPETVGNMSAMVTSA